MNTRKYSGSRQRGSALVLVLILTLAIVIISGSIVSWSLTERRLNSRSASWLEARNAAEAVAEYGCYQVAEAFNKNLNPTFTSTGTNPLNFPSSIASSFFSGSNVDTSSVALIAGNVTSVPASGLYYVDRNDPNNKYDQLAGDYVSRRDVTILAKASVNSPAGGAPITAYIEEKVSIRGAPLLAYAIFYSGNDLEFDETPKMDIFGPVHVNGNLFVGPAGSNPQALSFHGPVTASGNVYHAWRGTTTTAQEGGSNMSSSTPVYFSTDGVGATSSTLVNMRTSSGVWKDSTMGADSATNGLAALQNLITANISASFSQYASQTWHGSLQTAAMGIQSYNPMGFSEIVGHTSAGDLYATDPLADLNSNVGTSGGYSNPSGYGAAYGPHALIEPPLNPSSSDSYYAAKEAIEISKFSRKAGLYIQVSVDSSNSPTFTVYGDPNSAPAGTSSSNKGPNGGLKLGSLPAKVVQWVPYTTSGSGNSNVKYGLYDQHQDKGINLVQIDMAALKTALTDMEATGNGTVGTDFVGTDGKKWGLGTASANGYDPNTPNSTGWNGGVYIDVSQASNTYQTAIMLGNGTVSAGSSLVPPKSTAPNGVDGITIATNAPAYILGSFNTDDSIAGSSASNNSAMYPDDYPSVSNFKNSAESPMAIAADAVTVLSPDYFGTGGNSESHLAPTNWATAQTAGSTAYSSSGNGQNAYVSKSSGSNPPTATGNVEIAAALITGTVTTSADSSTTQMYSGGVHNLPRFLENWTTNGNIVAIRGSMISMFNSRVATVGWSQDYYSAPVRQWGYDKIFASGRYPPIIPAVISYRRVDFTYLKNAAEYATELGKL